MYDGYMHVTYTCAYICTYIMKIFLFMAAPVSFLLYFMALVSFLCANQTRVLRFTDSNHCRFLVLHAKQQGWYFWMHMNMVWVNVTFIIRSHSTRQILIAV